MSRQSINIDEHIQNYDREIRALRARLEASRQESTPIYQMITNATGDAQPMMISPISRRFIEEELRSTNQNIRQVTLPNLQPVRIRGEDWNEPSRFPRLHPTHRPSITPETRQYLDMLKEKEKILEMDDVFNRLNYS